MRAIIIISFFFFNCISAFGQLDIKEELGLISKNYSKDCLNYSMQSFEYEIVSSEKVLKDSMFLRVFKNGSIKYVLNDELETLNTDKIELLVDNSEHRIYFNYGKSKETRDVLSPSDQISHFLESRSESGLEYDFLSNPSPKRRGIRLYMDKTKKTRMEMVYNIDTHQLIEAKLYVSIPSRSNSNGSSNRLLKTNYIHYECGDVVGTRQVSDFVNLKGKKISSLHSDYKSYSINEFNN